MPHSCCTFRSSIALIKTFPAWTEFGTMPASRCHQYTRSYAFTFVDATIVWVSSLARDRLLLTISDLPGRELPCFGNQTLYLVVRNY